MRQRPTIAGLAHELNFTDSKAISQGLKAFVDSQGIPRSHFARADADEILRLATNYTKKFGRRLWGISGRFPNYPENEQFIIEKIAKILTVQQKNTADSIKAVSRKRRRDRRDRSSSAEELDESSDEEDESWNSEGSNQIDAKGISTTEVAQDQTMSSLQSGPNLGLVSLSQETQDSDWGDIPARKFCAINTDTSEQKPTGNSSRPSILHTEAVRTPYEFVKRPRLDPVSDSRRRTLDVMETTPVGTGTAWQHREIKSGPAFKQRRTTTNLVDSTSEVEGIPSAPPQLGRFAVAVGPSAISAVSSSEPVPEKRPERSGSVQSTGPMTFEYSMSRFSLERTQLEPLLLRILERFDDSDLEIRSRLRNARSEEEAYPDEVRLELLRSFTMSLGKDLQSLGAVMEG